MCDRSINSIHSTVKKMLIPTLEEQIKEMKEFSEKLYYDKQTKQKSNKR